jgi:hypothetical protein
VLSLESLQIRRNHNSLKSLSFFFSPALSISCSPRGLENLFFSGDLSTRTGPPTKDFAQTPARDTGPDNAGRLVLRTDQLVDQDRREVKTKTTKASKFFGGADRLFQRYQYSAETQHL